MDAPSAWLIAYDICDPGRLAKVFRFLKQEATPCQYSVFIGLLTNARVRFLLSRVALEIAARKDDVRVYPIASGVQPYVWGAGGLPKNILIGAGISGTLSPAAVFAHVAGGLPAQLTREADGVAGTENAEAEPPGGRGSN